MTLRIDPELAGIRERIRHSAAHVMAAIPNPLIQEFIAPSRIPWRNEVLREPLIVEDSCLVVPDRPGLGVEFDEAALKRHLVE